MALNLPNLFLSNHFLLEIQSTHTHTRTNAALTHLEKHVKKKEVALMKHKRGSRTYFLAFFHPVKELFSESHSTDVTVLFILCFTVDLKPYQVMAVTCKAVCMFT